MVHVGSLVSVAVKLIMNLWPAWPALGVKEKSPDAGSKAMLEASAFVESITGPPVPVGSFADTAKCSLPPTVAFWGPGTVMTGRTFAGRTFMIT